MNQKAVTLALAETLFVQGTITQHDINSISGRYFSRYEIYGHIRIYTHATNYEYSLLIVVADANPAKGKGTGKTGVWISNKDEREEDFVRRISLRIRKELNIHAIHT